MVVRAGVVARVVSSLAALSLVTVPAAAGAAGRSAAKAITLSTTTVNARWHEGWLRPGAAVLFSGSVSAASTLTAVLRPLDRPGIVTARTDFDLAGGGPFSKRIHLPPRALPGRYSLRVSGTTETGRIGPVQVTVEIPAPPEGVLDQAEVGTSPSGPWLLYKGNAPPVVHGRHTELWMRFRFLYPPTGHDVELLWKLHWHRIVGKITKRYKDTLYTTVSSASPLPSGHWSAVLKVDGRVSKKMDVVIR